jgi:hypothetical protein
MRFRLANCSLPGMLSVSPWESLAMTNRTVELLILLLIALYLLNFMMPKLFVALGGLVHVLLVAILLLVVVRLLQGRSVR